MVPGGDREGFDGVARERFTVPTVTVSTRTKVLGRGLIEGAEVRVIVHEDSYPINTCSTSCSREALHFLK
jgi:hypothetical protein